MKPPSSPPGLVAHLATCLGAWPPTTALDIVAAAHRLRPGWDGKVRPALGVAGPDGRAVLSVPPASADDARYWVRRGGLPAILTRLPAIVGDPQRRTYQAVFRWTTHPTDLPDVGTWLPADTPGLPDWLRPFGGQVLVVTDPDGTHLAGVGVKRHDAHGHELSVVTAPAARGRGLARALVAQAARRVLDGGAVPTYQHDPANVASAHVADAAGFPDRGWVSFGVGEATQPPSS